MPNAAKNVLTKLKSWVKWVNSTSISYNEPHIGISLGNTFTYVSVMEDNMPKLIRKTPSMATFMSKGGAHLNLVAFGIKQLLGIKFEDPLVHKEMERDLYHNKIVRGPDGYAWFKSTTGDLYDPVVLLAHVLKAIRLDAESYLGMPVSKAVVAIPPNCSDSKVNAAFQACGNGGLCVVQTVDEATAAAIAYGMHSKKEGTVFAVVNMGARTFHVSILEVGSNGDFVVKGFPKSDMFLGGVDFDNVLMEFMCKELKRIEGLDLMKLMRNELKSIEERELTHVYQLRFGAAKLKIDLSSASAVNLPFQVPSILTRNEFERMLSNLIGKVKAHCVNCLKDAHIASSDVDEVLLVGGMAKIPIVLKAVIEVFRKSPRTGVDPDEAVALGATAAIQAGVLCEDDWNVLVRSTNSEAV